MIILSLTKKKILELMNINNDNIHAKMKMYIG